MKIILLVIVIIITLLLILINNFDTKNRKLLKIGVSFKSDSLTEKTEYNSLGYDLGHLVPIDDNKGKINEALIIATPLIKDSTNIMYSEIYREALRHRVIEIMYNYMKDSR